MNRALRFAGVMLAGVLLVAGAMAQGVATADLSGTVRDPKGAVVSNATVTVRDEARAFERTTKTDTEGNYQFLLLPPGHYTLTVEASGFSKLVAKDVGVTVGQKAEFSVALKLATAVTEVTVTGEAALVETQRTSSTTTIDQERIDNLPINGRNYINFTLTDSQTTRDTAPSIGVAPTSGLNFGGQRARSNLVNVDGADAVDNSVNGIRSTVSQEAVQEFQIINNSYAAEYGRASGGVVNIITRSGGNAFHGTAFGYLRHRSIQADNPFTNVPNPAYTRVQAGFTLSGPIKKDKTFFFFSYETTRRQETGFSSIGANNFGLAGFDSSTLTCRFAPFFAPVPCPFGTIQVTPDQSAFLTATAGNPNPLFQIVRTNYIVLAGRSSGTALNGVWPVSLGGAAAFPTSGAPLPGSFVPLNGLVGNFPISEGTTVVALRLDHRFNNNQQGLLRVNVSPSTVTGLQPNTQNQVFGQNSFSRTAQQTFRDVNVTAQHTWSIGTNKINEFRFQYSRRGLLFNFARAGDSTGPFGDTNTLDDGSQVAVNIPGFAFFGREPFSYADRTEQRYQFTDNFSWVKGNHTIKFGGDYNRIPVDADFTVNFGGLYDFGSLSATSFSAAFAGFPAFSPVQAYGLGVPQDFIQQVGDPHAKFTNNSLGVFLQDSWRIKPNLTLNAGVRYDVEFMPNFPALNALSQTAQDALNITQTIPRDSNNVAPRIGIAWDPWKDGKTVFRASYGLFYDHPLLGLLFLSTVTDGTQAPGVILTPGAPAAGCSLNAVNSFQGLLNACPASFGALPSEQRFDASLPDSIFVNQNFLTAGVPLAFLSFGFPVDKRFEYAYSHQVNATMEHDFGGNFALSVAYNFNGGRHLNHSIDVNPVNSEALIVNWERAIADQLNGGTSTATVNTDPRLVGTSGAPCGVVPAGPLAGQPWVLPALINFFRQSGLNPSLAQYAPLAPCIPVALAVMAQFGLGVGANGEACNPLPFTPPYTAGDCVPVPFSFMNANRSNGSSVYHGLTVQMRKRFSRKYEFLASYTWSHAIDDSTDLQSPLSPQDNRRTDLERSNSTFDQRHRFVFSGVYQSGKLGGDGFGSKFFSNWTVAPIIEVGSGRPFNILVGSDANFDAGSKTDRPSIVPSGSLTPVGCLPPAASKFSPTGFLQPACFNDGAIDGIVSNPLIGNLGRNAGHRPYTVFTDFRVARRFNLSERVKMDGIVDMFNLINRFNVADVNLLYQGAGTPTSAFDARQFQFALKLSF